MLKKIRPGIGKKIIKNWKEWRNCAKIQIKKDNFSKSISGKIYLIKYAKLWFQNLTKINITWLMWSYWLIQKNNFYIANFQFLKNLKDLN